MRMRMMNKEREMKVEVDKTDHMRLKIEMNL